MSQVELLIFVFAQVACFFVAAVVILALLLRRQKKSISRLQLMLAGYQEEASGETLIKQLQLAIDDTTAHCAQETITLRPEATAEDQAVSLRYAALTYELRLLQSNNGEVTPWRTIIQPYTELAKLYYDHIQSIPDKVKVKFKGQMADMDKEHQRLEGNIKQLSGDLKQLSPIQDFFNQGFDDTASKNDIELSLHNSLVALCDTVEHAEGLREVVYLIHEAYYDHGNSTSESTTIQPTQAPPPSAEPGKHTVALNNIITEQNKLIHNLRTQLIQTDELEGGSELMAHLDVLEQNFKAAQIQIGQLEAQLKEAIENAGADSSEGGQDDDHEYSQNEMFELIEQFTEESAEMVERLHMLQNQNKKYSKENDDLREQLETTTEPGDDGEEAKPLVAGLQMKLESQNNEILQLQKEFKDVEDKYLALYEETMADMIGMSPTDTETQENANTTSNTSAEDIVTDSSDIDDLLANANNSKPNNNDKESENIVTDTSDIDDILASANLDKKS
ncbi:hypothetical protein A9Q81_25015 [Gammaproteobacteria bacterium 42_54_T18]|nr:hypothetical protein A9Q81_25015 [Gammaproteobacteria bacterium 42_54_T18]